MPVRLTVSYKERMRNKIENEKKQFQRDILKLEMCLNTSNAMPENLFYLSLGIEKNFTDQPM